MRGLETLFFVAFLGLAGLGVWNFRHWFQPHDPNPVTAVEAAAKLNATSHTPHKSAPQHDKGHILAQGDTLNSIGTSIVEVSVPRPPFPEAKDLRTGVTGVQIQAQFGEPTARVTGTQDGLLVEEFYYVNREKRRLTVAKLEDGVVVSAQSKHL